MIYILSSKKSAALGLGNKTVWAEILGRIPAGRSIQPDDQVYLDISGFSSAELRKAIAPLKKRCAGFFWGIIDPRGEAEDPASFFFMGACDYIGPVLIRKGLNKKRFADAFSCFRAEKDRVKGKTGSAVNEADGDSIEKRKNQKLPAGKFEGWKSMHAGTTASFFFLFVSISGKSNLRSRVGEAVFSVLKTRFREMLLQYLGDADALLWMETEDNSLFLVPPRSANGKSAVEAVLRILMSSRLIGIEKFGLSFPVEFTFALHYGKTLFRSPGKTGSVVSESVNYIFHLGTKRAEPGRLTISDDVPQEVIPEGLADLFSSGGEFEGIPIRHSRRFIIK